MQTLSSMQQSLCMRKSSIYWCASCEEIRVDLFESLIADEYLWHHVQQTRYEDDDVDNIAMYSIATSAFVRKYAHLIGQSLHSSHRGTEAGRVWILIPAARSSRTIRYHD